MIQHGGLALNIVPSRCANSKESKKALDGQCHLFLWGKEQLSAQEEQTRANFALAFSEISVAWWRKRKPAMPLLTSKWGCREMISVRRDRWNLSSNNLFGRQELTETQVARYKHAWEVSSHNEQKRYAQMRQVLIGFTLPLSYLKGR